MNSHFFIWINHTDTGQSSSSLSRSDKGKKGDNITGDIPAVVMRTIWKWKKKKLSRKQKKTTMTMDIL